MSKKFIIWRTGAASLSFAGEMLARSEGERHCGKEQNRWHELAVYRTVGGKFVVEINYGTRWQGEMERYFAKVCDTPEQVAATLRDHNPTEYITGFPAGEHYAEKQARLLADIQARYADQVSEILGELEFTEEVV